MNVVHRATWVALLGVAVSAVDLLAWAAPHTFVINDTSRRDVVEFTSDAPVELIKGSTNQVKGTVRYDDSFKFDAKHPFDIEFEVDLASMTTGIPLRDQHMRDNFLNTDKYPRAVFKATKIVTKAKPPFRKGQVVPITATGNLTLHGVTKPVTAPLYVTYFPESELSKKRYKQGNMIRIRGQFPVKLTDYGIQRPEAIFVKLAETVYVTVDVTGTDAP